MKPYIDTCHRILNEGKWKSNRTGKRALTISGASTTYDCSETYPLLTLKHVPIKSVIGELISFLQGATNAATFRANGTNIWTQNANENESWLANPYRQGEDDLGPVYGAMWRKWPAFKLIETGRPQWREIHTRLKADGWSMEEVHDGALYRKEIDQLYECYKKIMTNPDDRRNIFHAWNPAVLDEVALPACHVMYQFIANQETRVLDLCMLQR
jgi:thymidylate synthase